MQEEVTQKTIALAVSSTKMTGRVLLAVINHYLRQVKSKSVPKSYRGRQTLKQLSKQNAGLSNIEITDSNIKSFERVAKQYHVDYALKKDISEVPPRYIVFFKGRDVDAIQQAFKEYATVQMKQKAKPSIRQELAKLKDIIRLKPKQRAKEKIKERGVEL
nr:PcfB family protein [uncultured Caproiciproducens sp.]